MPKIYVKRIYLDGDTNSELVKFDNSFHSFVIKNFASVPAYIYFVSNDDAHPEDLPVSQPDKIYDDAMKILPMSYQVVSMSEENASANKVVVSIEPDTSAASLSSEENNARALSSSSSSYELEIQGIVDTTIPAIGNLSSQGGSESSSDEYNLISIMNNEVLGGMSLDLAKNNTPVGNDISTAGDLILTTTQMSQLLGDNNNHRTTLTDEQIAIVLKYNVIMFTGNLNEGVVINTAFYKSGQYASTSEDYVANTVCFYGNLLYFAQNISNNKAILTVNITNKEMKYGPEGLYSLDANNIIGSEGNTLQFSTNEANVLFASSLAIYNADSDVYTNLPILPALNSTITSSSNKWQLLYNPHTQQLEWVETDIPAVPAS